VADAPGQFVAPPLHVHALETQVPAPHATPQAPQFRASEERSTQRLPQTTWLAGHSQRPATHVAPNAHWTPQAPQAAWSDVRSTQWP
jgi:hypothetical protein